MPAFPSPVDNSENAVDNGSPRVRFTQILSSFLPNQNKELEDALLDSYSTAFILINFISVGYILNPAAFAQGGTILGTVCLALVSLQSMIAGVFILEACTRAEMLKISRSKIGSSHLTEEIMNNNASRGGGDEEAPPTEHLHRRYLPHGHSLQVHERTFELSELCRIFMGRGLRNFFTITTAGDLYGVTLTFAAIFGSSLSENFPFGSDWDYQIYIFVFMAITVPVSCMRISHQVPLQLLFLVLRTIMVLLMLGTLCAAWASDAHHFGAQSLPARDTPLANFSAIVTVLQMGVFSTAYQFSVPGLTAETGNKGGMGKIIAGSVSYIYVSNLILSLCMAIYFGSNTQESSNLNWLDYHGGTWDGTGEFTRAWWATAISSFIILFAALDGLAVYPLIAGSFGDFLMSVQYEDEVHDMEDRWKTRVGFRLLASVPQAVGSLFLKDLGLIAKYAGVFTLLSYTVCPAYLAIKSRQMVRKVHLPTETKYKTIISNDWVAWTLMILALCLIVAVVVDGIIGFDSADLDNYGEESNIQDDPLFLFSNDTDNNVTMISTRPEAAKGLVVVDMDEDFFG